MVAVGDVQPVDTARLRRTQVQRSPGLDAGPAVQPPVDERCVGRDAQREASARPHDDALPRHDQIPNLRDREGESLGDVPGDVPGRDREDVASGRGALPAVDATVPCQLAGLLARAGEKDLVAPHQQNRVRRFVDRIVERERIVVPVAVRRDDRVLRMLDDDLRRDRVELDLVRQRDRPVRAQELHHRPVDTVRHEQTGLGDAVPHQVERRTRLHGAVGEQRRDRVAVAVFDHDVDPLPGPHPEADMCDRLELARRGEDGIDVRAVDRGPLELRPLGQREGSGAPREQGEDERRRQDPGHARRILCGVVCGDPACAHPSRLEAAARPDEERDHAEHEAGDDDRIRVRHSHDLDPREDQHRAEGDPQSALRHADREVRADQHTGNRSDEEPGHRIQVDIPVQQMAGAGDPQQQRGVEHVGADDPARRQREEQQHREAEERAGPDRRQSDDEPEDRADQRWRRPCRGAGGGTRRRSSGHG